MTDIGDALKHGSAQELSKYFDKEIRITFFEKSQKYNRTTAITALQKFFSKIEPKNYRPWQKGSSSNHQYYIGYLQTSSTTYKVYLLFLQRGNNFVLQELRFEN
jgi:hypothetical protein